MNATPPTESTQAELLPCPFCGSVQPQTGRDAENLVDVAFCAECLAEVALDKWNTRASSPAQAESDGEAMRQACVTAIDNLLGYEQVGKLKTIILDTLKAVQVPPKGSAE